ncbi:hypothetical protein RQP46_006247 [Phenoliferia psychrophenolica]
MPLAKGDACTTCHSIPDDDDEAEEPLWGVLKMTPGVDRVLDSTFDGRGAQKSLEELDTTSLQWLRIKVDSQIEVLDRLFAPTTIEALSFDNLGESSYPLSESSTSPSSAASLGTEPTSDFNRDFAALFGSDFTTSTSTSLYSSPQQSPNLGAPYVSPSDVLLSAPTLPFLSPRSVLARIPNDPPGGDGGTDWLNEGLKDQNKGFLGEWNWEGSLFGELGQSS